MHLDSFISAFFHLVSVYPNGTTCCLFTLNSPVSKTNPPMQYIGELKPHLGTYRACPGCRSSPCATELVQLLSKGSTIHNVIPEHPRLLALMPNL